MPQDHTYRSSLSWSGSTAQGIARYDRTHQVSTPPARDRLRLSADPSFRGDPDLVNPEQLLLAAASSCQLLSFLAVAARAGLTVLAYRDDAEAVMPESAGSMRIEQILLRPRITVPAGTDEAAVLQAVDDAHDQCYVANTLTATISIRTTVEPVAEHAGAHSGSGA